MVQIKVYMPGGRIEHFIDMEPNQISAATNGFLQFSIKHRTTDGEKGMKIYKYSGMPYEIIREDWEV